VCTAVISDTGSGFGENPMFHSGKQQFSPENDSSRPRASTPWSKANLQQKLSLEIVDYTIGIFTQLILDF